MNTSAERTCGCAAVRRWRLGAVLGVAAFVLGAVLALSPGLCEPGAAWAAEFDGEAPFPEYTDIDIAPGIVPREAQQGVAPADVAPPWYPNDISTFHRFHNDPATTRVVDQADMLTPTEEAEMALLIAMFREETGADFVIYTTSTSYGLSHQLLAVDFYDFNGYGLGDDFSGYVFMVCFEQGNRGYYLAATGKCQALLSEKAFNRLADDIQGDMEGGRYAEACRTLLDEATVLTTEGEIPRESSDWTIAAGMSAVVGVLVGALFGRGRKKKMVTIQTATEARNYVAAGSLQVTHSVDNLTGVTAVRVPIARNEGKGGGYSGGFSSSGGGSFSGGGRSF